MTLSDYHSRGYKSRERVKKHGEVFTPEWMVKKMCDMLEVENGGAECWRGTVLEPSCGTGNFLVEILNRKLSIGMSQTEAASTLFAVDIMQDNIDESIRRLTEIAPLAEDIFKKNIVCGNFLHPDGIWFLEN